MGHFYTEVTATGKDRQEAQAAAIADFLFENGQRHSVREVTKPRLLRRVPPKVRRETLKQGKPWLGMPNYVIVEMVEDLSAPKRDWLEEWQFTLHTHA
jgi:hypothetical protein